MANFKTPTQAQISRDIRHAMGLKGRGTPNVVGADVLVGVEVRWTGTKNLAELELESAEYLVWAGSRLAREIKQRTISGRLPTRHRTAPLSKNYLPYKQSQGGRAMRDGVVTGQMWRGWRVAKPKGNTSVKIGFAGNHKSYAGDEYKEDYTASRGKYKGIRRRRNVTNQMVANRWALRTRKGYALPESYSGRPAHAFTEADDIQKRWLPRQYEMRVLNIGLDNLPPIKGMGERTARGQKRKFERIQPRSSR